MRDVLLGLNDFLIWVNGQLGVMPYWTSSLLLALGCFWLYLKVRRVSILVMFIGFGLTAASMIFTYFEGNYFFDESLLGTTSVPQKTMEILSEIGTNLSYLMFMVGVLGFLWFVSQVKPRDNRKTANKSSNTDASDAGAS